MEGLNFTFASKALPNKDIISTVEDAVKGLVKEEADKICAIISLTFPNSKPSKDNLSKDECNVWKNYSLLPTEKCRSTVILSSQDHLEKCMDHIKNLADQLLVKDPTRRIKAKTLKQLKFLNGKKFIDNKLY